MSIHVDFSQGAVNSFTATGGTPTYGPDGVTFTVAQPGDAPQLNSIFYIMFGRVELTVKAAPGAGIVTSLVLESDVLDEIDIEWLGADPDELQTNYFGKGQTTTYNRGQFNPAAGSQAGFITYTIDWTAERIVWSVAGTVVRTLSYADAEANKYPQTPMRVKFGAWSGGDPSNPPGTISWARGPTEYTKGPFRMVVSKLSVTDYSTGKYYKYTDQSGSWQSISAIGGSINGNLNGAGSLTVTASASAATSLSPSIPVGGIGNGIGKGSTTTQTGWPWAPTSATSDDDDIPSGWAINSNGRILPIGTGVPLRPPHLALLAGPLVLGALAALVGQWS